MNRHGKLWVDAGLEQAQTVATIRYLTDCACAQSQACRGKSAPVKDQAISREGTLNLGVSEEALTKNSADPYELTKSILFEIKNKKISDMGVLEDFLLARSRVLPKRFEVIYPFGTNASQMKAVETALTHSLSVISGPPGTGKTQTLLNLIANIVASGQTCAIVSNNNAATDNVLEKLKKEAPSLYAMTARLGSRAMRRTFFEDGVTAVPSLNNPEKITLKELLSLRQKALKYHRLKARAARLMGAVRSLKAQAFNHIDLIDEIKSNSSITLSKKLASHSLRLRKVLHESERLQTLRSQVARQGFLEIVKRVFFQTKLRFYGLHYAPESALAAQRLCTALALQRQIQDLGEQATLVQAKAEKLIEADLRLKAASQALLEKAVSQQMKGVGPSSATEVNFRNDEAFWNRYRIVTSSSYALAASVPRFKRFDWIIMDEAGQVNLTTGAACLSLADRAVIIGDERQLPMIVSETLPPRPQSVPEAMDVAEQSVLTRLIQEERSAVPVTLLAEHYRCHPSVIDFCNRAFYDDALIAMRQETDTGALQWLKAKESPLKHRGGSWQNVHQALMTAKTLKELERGGISPSEIAVVVPFRAQAQLCRGLGVSSDTVHKFQGQEQRAIILSSVVNTPSAFIEDAHLLNVAVSRAKDRLVVIAPDWRARGGLWASLQRYALSLNERRDSESSLPVIVSLAKEQPQKIGLCDRQGPLAYLRNYRLRDLFPLHVLNSLKSKEEFSALAAGLCAPILLYRGIDFQPLAVMAPVGSVHPRLAACLAMLHLPLLTYSGKATPERIAARWYTFEADAAKGRGAL